MLNSKQRSALSAKANALDSIFQVGKDNITDNLIGAVSDALEARELIKLTVLKSADSAQDIAGVLAKKTRAEVVRVIGNKIILYRRSSRKDFEHLL